MKNIFFIPLFLLAFFSFKRTNAQMPLFVRGRLMDAKDSTQIQDAVVVLFNWSDTLKFEKTVSDSVGRFGFMNVAPGKYKLRIFFPSYITFEKEINIEDKPVFLKRLALVPDPRFLKEVKVEGVQTRQEQKGDTTIYNADAFKVNKDANTEDLVKKMPGITVENGQVKHQGEDVKKVLVDGREFFGDDVNMALKNLPAEMVDRVQVFDRASDQSGFSGFDDGGSQKTINVLTKNNKNAGMFGKLYSGGGVDEAQNARYQAGGSYNYFKGIKKITLLGMTNNINMQNFGSQDLLGISGGSPGGGKMMGMSGGSGGYKPPGSYGGGMNYNNGPTSGIATTHTAGFNYTDVWGKKTIATASYFFNYTDNTNDSKMTRNYFSKEGIGQQYGEDKLARSLNQNHRLSLRLEYYLDSMNSFIFNPRFNTQNNNSTSGTNGLTSLMDSALTGTSLKNTAHNVGFNSTNSLLYRHCFKKYGRTFSVSVSADINRKTNETTLLSDNRYYFPNDTTISLDQNADVLTDGNKYDGSLAWTEPVGTSGMLNITYTPQFNFNHSDKRTYDFENTTESYSRLDTALSNVFDNNVFTQKGGFAYRIKKTKWNFTFGANFQNVLLTGNSIYPTNAEVNKTFNSVLPSATFQYKFEKGNNLRISYRSSTNAPSVSQLQSVVDNSNTLLLSTGNPDLKQSYSHFLMTRYNATNTKTSRSIFLFIMGYLTNNYAANSTILARQDTTLNGGIILHKGSQLTMPVNINGNYTVRGMATYSTPFKAIKSTLNINLGGYYTNLPGFVNSEKNISKTTNVNGGFTISSNISEKVDFNVTYTANYNFVTNTIQTQGNSNYFQQLSSARFNWAIWKGLVYSTDATHTYYNGLSNSFVQNYLLWTNSLAYKFGEKKLTELKFTCFDVLKQNNSVTRNITETYIEDNQFTILQRYYMLTLTWNFRKFQGGAQMPAPEEKKGGMHGH